MNTTTIDDVKALFQYLRKIQMFHLVKIRVMHRSMEGACWASLDEFGKGVISQTKVTEVIHRVTKLKWTVEILN